MDLDSRRMNTRRLNRRSIRQRARPTLLRPRREARIVLGLELAREGIAELLVGGELLEMRRTVHALHVEGLRRLRVAEVLVLWEVVADHSSLVEIHAVLAVGELAPAAAVEHAACVGRLLEAVVAFVLWTVESPPVGFDLELALETLHVVCAGA